MSIFTCITCSFSLSSFWRLRRSSSYRLRIRSRSLNVSSFAWVASPARSMSSSQSWFFAASVRSIAASWLSNPTRSSRNRFAICSYVFLIDSASLYLIMALSRRFSNVRIFRVCGESSRFGRRLSSSKSETSSLSFSRVPVALLTL